MPAKKEPPASVHDNFITGVALCQAHRNFSTIRAAAEFLGILEITLHKIMNRGQRPTYDQIVILCRREGLSANWLMLNEGSPYLREQVQLTDIANEIKALRHDLYIKDAV